MLWFCEEIMITSLEDFHRPFFIGIAGSGMSAIAQYLKGVGKEVSGSDRFFKANEANETKQKLEAEGILCFPQDGTGIHTGTDLIVVSAAVEDTVVEVQKAKELNIPIIKRSELLAIIAASKKTIAVGGTSGKSTTSAMFEVFPVKCNGSFDDLARSVFILEIINRHFLIFQDLVLFKEISKLQEKMIREILNIMVMIDGWIFRRNRDNLIIHFAIVNHLHVPNHIGFYEAKRLNRL